MRRYGYGLFVALVAAWATPLIAQDPPKPARHTISIKNMQFAPGSLSIKAGDTVVWTNADDRDHTVVAADNSFKSDNLRPKASFSYTFSKPGTFAYACSYHPRMRGTVIVTGTNQPG